MKEESLSSWRDLDQRIRDCRNELSKDKSERSPLLFRGQSDASWALKTTLERVSWPDGTLLQYYGMIARFLDEVEDYGESKFDQFNLTAISNLFSDYLEFTTNLSFGTIPHLSYLVYLRHHGFPSPLLDWTMSARIALYFAFAGALKARHVSLYILRPPLKLIVHSTGEPRIWRLTQAVRPHRRHFLQRSVYTVSLLSQQTDWRFVEHDNLSSTALNPGQDSQLIKLNLPSSERNEVLSGLDEYNLNDFSLFGSPESLMRTLWERHSKL